jgi:hypothetical protein
VLDSAIVLWLTVQADTFDGGHAAEHDKITGVMANVMKILDQFVVNFFAFCRKK